MKIIEKLIQAAENHGDDSGELSTTVNDLKTLLRNSWVLLSLDQRQEFLTSAGIDELVSAGARGEFTTMDLVNGFKQNIAAKEAEITARGYAIETDFPYYFWETDDETSEYFMSYDAAVADAYSNLASQAVVAKVNSTMSQPAPETVTVRLTLDVVYDLNGETADDMASSLRNMAVNAIGNGLLTGYSDAEVESYSMEAVIKSETR